MKSCNNCVSLGRDCMVEPEDRVRSAENCDQYYSIDDAFDRRWAVYQSTGEWPLDDY